MSDITEEPILPQPKKARAARRRKKRRGSSRLDLDAINARTGRQYLGLSPTSYPLTLQKAMHGLTRADQKLSDRQSRTPTVTVVLPVYNERETLAALAARLIPVLDRVVGDAFEVRLRPCAGGAVRWVTRTASRATSPPRRRVSSTICWPSSSRPSSIWSRDSDCPLASASSLLYGSLRAVMMERAMAGEKD